MCGSSRPCGAVSDVCLRHETNPWIWLSGYNCFFTTKKQAKGTVFWRFQETEGCFSIGFVFRRHKNTGYHGTYLRIWYIPNIVVHRFILENFWSYQKSGFRIGQARHFSSYFRKHEKYVDFQIFFEVRKKLWCVSWILITDSWS